MDLNFQTATKMANRAREEAERPMLKEGESFRD